MKLASRSKCVHLLCALMAYCFIIRHLYLKYIDIKSLWHKTHSHISTFVCECGETVEARWLRSSVNVSNSVCCLRPYSGQLSVSWRIVFILLFRTEPVILRCFEVPSLNRNSQRLWWTLHFFHCQRRQDFRKRKVYANIIVYHLHYLNYEVKRGDRRTI